MQLDRALKLAARIQEELAPYCEIIQIAGSIRRLRPNVNDIDLVCIPRDRAGLRARIAQKCTIKSDGPQFILASLPLPQSAIRNPQSEFQIDLWMAHGETKDLVSSTPSNYGSLFLCRTGSKQFNIWFAQQAQRRDLHWNPHMGLFAGHALICSSREEDLFAALEIPFIKPEDRER